MFDDYESGLGSVQELRDFERMLYEIADEFVHEKDSYTDPILVVFQRDGKVSAMICERSEAGDENGRSKEFYSISDFVNEEGVDYDELSDIC